MRPIVELLAKLDTPKATPEPTPTVDNAIPSAIFKVFIGILLDTRIGI